MRPYTEEPGAEQFARPVLDWRRREQSIRRPYGKKRALGIPAMKDRAMQALYLLALDPVAETTADINSDGVRPQRSTADAIEQCFTTLGNIHTAQWILEGDIKSGVDGISHEWLLTHSPMEKSMLRKWLKSGYIDKNVLYPTEEGTPQGGIISPVLANMTLDGLERRLRVQFPKTTGKGIAAKVNFVRYADDFIVTAASKERLEQEGKPLIEAFLKERGVELSAEKSRVTHIEDGFDFLGQNIRKYTTGKQHTLLITPAQKNDTIPISV
jgi:RNA-directed DNA polymerase